VNGTDWPSASFETHRPHLRAVAYRMLGSLSEADDAVQEGWLRLSRSGTGDIENLRAWLTTVVSRVCLDMLRARAARREEIAEAFNAAARGGDFAELLNVLAPDVVLRVDAGAGPLGPSSA
jgi:RNA polymerase sigma factor (sigma-70 family)